MASSGNQDPTGDVVPADEPTIEAAARVEQAVAADAAGSAVAPDGAAPESRTDDDVVSGADEPTVARPAIPPLLTDPAAGDPEIEAAVEDAEASEGEGAPTTLGAPASKERLAEAAASARESVAEGAAHARERGAEAAAVAREKGAEAASLVKEKSAETAAQAKEKSAKARARLASAASGAKGRASSAASEARERAASADVEGFARNTTSLIDTARPFFLAGCAALFAVLGFLEGDSGVAQIFAIGALIFVIGAAFSGEINAFLASKSHAHEHRDAPTTASEDDGKA